MISHGVVGKPGNGRFGFGSCAAPLKTRHVMENIDTQASAVGHIPSGLFVVCAQDPESGSIDGYLASWVQQVSFEPLMIALAVKPGRPAYGRIMDGKVFSVNVVGEHDSSYMKRFWHGYDPDDNPFDTLETERGRYGGIILKAAKSTLECKRRSSARPGDHEVVFAEVLGDTIRHHESRPLVHIRESGTSY
ncbi:MAG: flavin reductase family protein [Proteobacteria bacterium]|nr:flavin reductase family protein [Pseudomonadota bacterium]